MIFRGRDGNPGCVQNTCAHRACPLHLGSVNEGRIQCPYHGKFSDSRNVDVEARLKQISYCSINSQGGSTQPMESVRKCHQPECLM